MTAALIMLVSANSYHKQELKETKQHVLQCTLKCSNLSMTTPDILSQFSTLGSMQCQQRFKALKEVLHKQWVTSLCMKTLGSVKLYKIQVGLGNSFGCSLALFSHRA